MENTTATTNTIPNLDAMTREELQAFQERYENPTDDEAAALIGDRRDGYQALARRLAGYAMLKDAAMRHRMAGSINDARAYEDHCDEEHEKLPEDLRW